MVVSLRRDQAAGDRNPINRAIPFSGFAARGS
jgi:hypothetical protein